MTAPQQVDFRKFTKKSSKAQPSRSERALLQQEEHAPSRSRSEDATSNPSAVSFAKAVGNLGDDESEEDTGRKNPDSEGAVLSSALMYIYFTDIISCTVGIVRKQTPKLVSRTEKPAHRLRARDFADTEKTLIVRAAREYEAHILATNAFPNATDRAEFAVSSWRAANKLVGDDGKFRATLEILSLVREPWPNAVCLSLIILLIRFRSGDPGYEVHV